MEELRSTDILDREIEADAAKKVQKILKAAESECKNVMDFVAKRLECETQKKKEDFSRKLSQFKKNEEAAIPLKKSRFLVEFCIREVSVAFCDYLKSLDTKKIFLLIEKKFSNLEKIWENRKIFVSVCNLPQNEIQKFLEKKFGSQILRIENCDFENFREKIDLQKNFPRDIFWGMIFTSEDQKIRWKFSAEQLLNECLDFKREELVKTLFGGRIPE